MQLVWVMLAMVAVLIAEEMREIVLWWQYHSTRGTDRLGLARNLLYRLYDHNVHMKAVGWLIASWTGATILAGAYADGGDELFGVTPARRVNEWQTPLGIGLAIFFHFFQFMSDLLALVPTVGKMHLAVMRMISDNVSSWLSSSCSSSYSTACR